MERLIIDRFESNYAVCEKEDGSFVDVLKNKLPKWAEEGDCIINNDGIYTIDKSETKARAEKINNMFWQLYED